MISSGKEKRKRRRGKSKPLKESKRSKSEKTQTAEAIEDQEDYVAQIPSFPLHHTPLLPTSCSASKGDRWYEIAAETVSTKSAKPILVSQLTRLRQQADELMAHEDSLIRNDSWMHKMLRKGTLRDRIATMTVAISQDPLHQLSNLRELMALACDSTNSRIVTWAAQALQDLWITNLLPHNRKLQRMSTNTPSPRMLLYARWEELLLEQFERFMKDYISKTLASAVDQHARLQAIRTASVLLRSIPTGEAQLLAILVNKLGDSSIHATAAHELRLVTQEHPGIPVAREVQQFVFRPGQTAVLQGVQFLSQLSLRKDDLPGSLMDTYFKLFQVATQQYNNSAKQKVSSQGSKAKSASTQHQASNRLLSALLTGINRALPYLPENSSRMQGHVDALFRVVHTCAPSAAVQALWLLFHIDPSDRFFRALYVTIDQHGFLRQGGKKYTTLYFNLVYKAILKDTDRNRVRAVTKKLVSTGLNSSSAILAASLFLVTHVAETHAFLKEECSSVLVEDWTLDTQQRNPRFALVRPKGDGSLCTDKVDCATDRTSSCWERHMARHHYHPAVRKFATMNNGGYSGDPLSDFSLRAFLDKFSYRNPKKEKVSSKAALGRPVESQALPLNDPRQWQEEDIEHPEENIFRHFFSERSRRDAIKGVGSLQKKVETTEDEAVLEQEGKSFDEYAANWQEDSDEEAYIDSLAVEIMDDASADLDDEDPDMDEWEDLREDDSLEGGSESDDRSTIDEEDEVHYVSAADSDSDV